ncbi:EAL domain-containing protein [Niallia endozanthoxylica]|uniref:EAL domain-containing protein n=1 Tax=Niallia endozanthoxylica TaxID=2036016 RepID=A0A5J5HS73_9BACI|nr:EAL domain-containing protein [Niallia endozanthoxylica]KAA9022877.1 EAL domain-containing protein [Niallia endozanthoxylica]
MLDCNVCYPSDLNYEIKISGESNKNYFPDILLHLQRKKLLVSYEENVLVVKELAIQDLYDFFCDHLDMETISFRIDNKEWKPIRQISETFDSKWIDQIILEESVQSYVQPIVDETEEIYGYEMLARFIKEEGQFYSPFEAFSAAKARNRTYSLDRVCRMTAVRHAGFTNKKVFINFIPTSIYSPEHCLKTTTQLTNQLGIAPSHFVFEVVETEQVEDLNHLKRILMYYKDKGFEYALDDVGEGFSTIEVLKELSPNYMKLDMKFVQGVAADSDKQETAMNILQTAKQVGAIPLAEGIESRDDFIWLKNIGYKLFQGYLFGKPAAIKDSND